MSKQTVSLQAKDGPASILDVAAFLVSPWVLPTLVTVEVMGYKAWNVVLAGLAALTPAWFMPGEAIAASLGILVSLVFALRSRHAELRIAALALTVFLPAAMFVLLTLDGSDQAVFGAYKTVFGLLFLTGPWLIAFASWMDDRTNVK